MPVDRIGAAVRAFWRMLCAGLIGGGVFLAATHIRWPLMWDTDRATFLALAAGLSFVGVVGAFFAASALRWLLLAIWPGPLRIRIDAAAISMQLGPFGRRRFDWGRMAVRLDGGVDPELIHELPDDAYTVRLTHPLANGDLGEMIGRFTGLDGESLNAALRPFLRNPRDASGETAI